MKILDNLLLTSFKRVLYRNNGEKKNILIFRNGSLGDSICALPAIYSINQHFKTAQIDLLTNTGASHLVGLKSLINHQLIHTFIDYSSLSTLQLFKIIRKNKYHLIIELTQVNEPISRQIRNMIFFRLAGIKRGFGWQPPLTQKNRVQNLKKRKFVRESERLLQMLESNGINAIPEKYPLQLSEDDVSIVNELLKRNGLNGKEKNVGIVLGAKRPQNRWPLAYYNEVIHYLISENYHCLLIGGPGDQLLAQQLSPSKNIHDFTGKLNPVQSSLVFGNCQFAISNDTGPMHLAYAAGTYVFALFSSRDYPIIWYPPEEKSTVFRNNEIDCAVCFSETCSNNICMQAIKPDVVINAIKIYLSNSNNS